jgi:hypothetical protein
VAREAIEKLVSDLEPGGRRVRVRVEPFHETGWLVQDLAAQVLRARGLEVVEAPVSAAPPPAAGGAPAPADTARGAGADSAQAPADSAQAPADSAQAGGSNAQAGADTAQVEDSPQVPGIRFPQAAGGVTGTGSFPPPAPKVEETVREIGPPVDAELDLRVVELGLRYTGSRRARFFGGRRVERYAAAQLHGELRGRGDSAVRWSKDAEASAIDEVSESALAILEGQRYPFTAPTLPARRAGRVIEPVIVSVIVVGLVFLFVSNRS